MYMMYTEHNSPVPIVLRHVLLPFINHLCLPRQLHIHVIYTDMLLCIYIKPRNYRMRGNMVFIPD